MKPLVITLAVLSVVVAMVLLTVGTAQWLAVALMVLSLIALVTTAGAASSDLP